MRLLETLKNTVTYDETEEIEKFNPNIGEAVENLKLLGLMQDDILSVISTIDTNNMSVDDIVQAVLSKI